MTAYLYVTGKNITFMFRKEHTRVMSRWEILGASSKPLLPDCSCRQAHINRTTDSHWAQAIICWLHDFLRQANVHSTHIIQMKSKYVPFWFLMESWFLRHLFVSMNSAFLSSSCCSLFWNKTFHFTTNAAPWQTTQGTDQAITILLTDQNL
jgi:hypothetical protein